ncbi:MAG: geranylgeranylglyceryl/heptaprenylglyceryl phosphate synthase [Flavobacteriales bacterium]|nr:geranylgeranylglyceryl/heptaprenylglyceryl phosphate synthase [Flavobacteriales bacterium]
MKFDLHKSDRKLAVLIDPDKHKADELYDYLNGIKLIDPDYVLIGSSLIHDSNIEIVARITKSIIHKPLVLFPGHFTQLNDEVDAVLLLSLISGRNSEHLIGQHVLAAPKLKTLKSDIISPGYMLIDGGNLTSVGYMSNTHPIPREKADIAVCTAIAGEYIGMKLIYMDAGSGAELPINPAMVKKVAKAVDIPVIVGGGIRSSDQLDDYWNNGANLVVIGNALEESNEMLSGELKAREKH